MSSRSALRGALVAAAVVVLAALLTPPVRRRALAGLGRAKQADPPQPTHIVLPDRVPAATSAELDDAIAEGRSIGSGDIALTGA